MNKCTESKGRLTNSCTLVTICQNEISPPLAIFQDIRAGLFPAD